MKARKLFSFLLLLMLCAGLFCLSAAAAEEPTIVAVGTCGDNLIWTMDNEGTLTILGTGEMDSWSSASAVPWDPYRSDIRSVSLPMGLTGIGRYAFIRCAALTEITIPDSVTSIGYGAFCNCPALAEVTLSNSLTDIGNNAFSSCAALTEITIPDSVTFIDTFAFSGCSSLRSVTFGSGLTGIGEFAFSSCGALTGLSFPDSLRYIGDCAFQYCFGLTEVTLPDSITYASAKPFDRCDNLIAYRAVPNSTVFYSVDGVLYTKDMKTLVACPPNRTSFTIPDSVTVIGSGAFYDCQRLQAITIPDGVTAIGDYAFEACLSLASVTIPGSVASIGDYAFEHCSALAELTISEGVVSIGRSAFRACEQLTELTIPGSVDSIGYAAFGACLGLTELTIRDGVPAIGSNAFESCTSLTSLTLPDSVTAIEWYAFSNCSHLSEVFLPGSITAIGPHAFNGCSRLSDVYYDGTLAQWNAISISYNNDPLLNAARHIADVVASGICGADGYNLTWTLDKAGTLTISGEGAMAFYASSELQPWKAYRSDIRTVSLPEGLTVIPMSTFFLLQNLTSITIPASVTSIGTAAFSGCTSLADLRVDPDNPVYCVVDGVLYTKDMKTLVAAPHASGVFAVPEGVTSILSSSFDFCADLTGIRIPDSVTAIDTPNFFRCSSLTDIQISPDNPAYCALNGAIYSKDVKTLLAWPSPGAFAVIPQGVTCICPNAFSAPDLTSVALPDTVTEIQSVAFGNCHGITDVFYSGTEAQWRAIRFAIFNDPLLNATRHAVLASGICGEELVWTLDTAGNLVIVGSGAMGGWSYPYQVPWAAYKSDIRTVSLPDGLTLIHNYAFHACTGLTEVSIPDSVTLVGYSAFGGCSGLSKITISENAATIRENAFSNCTGLTEITIPDSVTVIEEYAFTDCTGLREIRFGSGLTYIGSLAFYGCSGLTEVTLPDSLSYLGGLAFLECRSLTDLTVPDSLLSFSAAMTGDCPNLTAYHTAPNSSVYRSVDGVLYTKDMKTLVAFPSGRTSFTAPDGVTTIRASAFVRCRLLTSVTLPNGVTSIGNTAFNFCTSLTDITIPGSVASIDESAFFNCILLSDVYFGGTAEQWAAVSIGDSNDPLLNAAIHFAEPAPSAVITGCTGFSASASVTNPTAQPLTAILATYDADGRLLASQAFTCPAGAETPLILRSRQLASVKLFLLDERGRPVTDALSAQP